MENNIHDLVKLENEKYYFNNVDFNTLIEKEFEDLFFLSLTNKLIENKNVKTLLENILNALALEIELSPSSHCLKTCLKTNAPVNVLIASGILAINENYGLNIMQCMQVLKSSIKDMHDINLSIDEQAEITVQHYYQSNKTIIPGYHLLDNQNHKNYKDEVIVNILKEKITNLGFESNYVKLAYAISNAYKTVFNIEVKITPLSLASAAMLEIGLEPKHGPAMFIMAKMPILFSLIFNEK